MRMNKNDTIAVIRSLLSSTKYPYSVSNLNREFKNETGMDIPLFGYNNIADFLLSVPQVVKLSGLYPVQKVSLVTSEKSAHIVSLVKRQKCSKQWRKVPSGKNFSKKTRFIASCTEAQESPKIMDKENCMNFKKQNGEDQSLMSSGLTGFRNGFCTYESVSLIDMKLHASVGEYIEVCPCEILGPHKFFFHLRKFKKKFASFMNGLQKFYESPEKIPKLTPSLIRPKQICAAFHKIHSEAKWYRAEIDEVVSDFQVIVNFIDFGTREKVPKKNLKHLHRNFISLPRQACPGFLANIKPLGSEWSSSAIKRFTDLAFEKDLVAGVVHLDTKANCTGMALSSTKGKEIHINDALVKEGYAEFEIGVSDRKLTGRSSENSRMYLAERQLYREKADSRSNWMTEVMDVSPLSVLLENCYLAE